MNSEKEKVEGQAMTPKADIRVTPLDKTVSVTLTRDAPSFTMEEVYAAVREWECTDEGMNHPPIFDGGFVELDGKRVKYYTIGEGWRLVVKRKD